MSEEKAIYVTAEEKMRSTLESVQSYLLTSPEGATKEILYQIDEALAMKSPDIKKLKKDAFSTGYKQRETEHWLKAKFVQALIGDAGDNETITQLTELPTSIKTQSSAIAALTADIEKLRLSIAASKNQSWELVLCATVTEVGKTKEKYTNEKARNMAVEQLLREDKLYLDSVDEVSRKDCELRKEQIQLEFLHNSFSAYRAIAGVR